MLKATLDTKDGRRMLLLILERGNITHLENKKPIHIHAEEMFAPIFNMNEILICFFETQEEAVKYFKEQQLITKNTEFHMEKIQ